MRIKKIVYYFLLLVMLTFAGVASANAPYASILAYNQNAYSVGINTIPNMNIIGKLNIINLTPWEIFIGSPSTPPNWNIMNGFSGYLLGSTNPATITPFWLRGITGVKDSSIAGSTVKKPSGFAFHSVQIGLSDPNNAWIQAGSCSTGAASQSTQNCFNSVDLTYKASAASPPDVTWGEYLAKTGYLSVPIVFNSSTGTTGNNTAAINFMVTSSLGFAQVSDIKGIGGTTYSYSPAYSLSFGDGTNNYALRTQATYAGKAKDLPAQNQLHNVSQFLTVQATGSNENQWIPVPMSNGGAYTPSFLNIAALAYPNFSAHSGVSAVANVPFDLVVMLQSGDYADLSLIFLATPSSPSSAVKRK